MRQLLEAVVYVFVLSGTFLAAHGAIYSTRDSAVKFSQCLVAKISESPFFNLRDCSDLRDVASDMETAMMTAGHGPRLPITLKIIAIGFVASVADIIILEDLERNVLRKGAYALALEECSVISIGYIDTDFVNEAFRILTTLQNSRISVHDNPSAFGAASEGLSSGSFVGSHLNPVDHTGGPAAGLESHGENPVRSPLNTNLDSQRQVRDPSRGPINPVRSTGDYDELPVIGLAVPAEGPVGQVEDPTRGPVGPAGSLGSHVRGPIVPAGGAVGHVGDPAKGPVVPAGGSKGQARPVIPVGGPEDQIQLSRRPFVRIEDQRGQVEYPVIDTVVPAEGIVGQFGDLSKGPNVPAKAPERQVEEPTRGPIVPTGDPGSQVKEMFIEPVVPAAGPGMFDPTIVHPSPLQKTSDFDLKDKTLFEPPAISFGMSSSSTISQSNLKSEFPEQPERNFGTSPEPSSTSVLQSGTDFGDIATSSMTSQSGNGAPFTGNPRPLQRPQRPLSHPQSAPFQTSPFMLHVPPTKETAFFVVPPSSVPQSAANVAFQNQMVSKTEDPIQPSSEMSPALTQENLATVTHPTPFVQSSTEFIDIQTSPTSSTPSLESIISDILMNSQSFRNAFNSGMDRKDVLKMARIITEESLSGYESDIINEAMEAVSREVATVKPGSAPESYALALSTALAYVLKLHNIPLFVDGTSIASSMVTNLDSTRENSDPQVFVTEGVTGSSIANDNSQSWEQQSIPMDFQSHFLPPEDVQSDIFSNTLSQYLTGSFRMANIFCGDDFSSTRLQMYCTLINTALSDYGAQASNIAASAISEVLAELSTERLCSSYARVISDTVAEVFYKNGLLESANPEEISEKFELSADRLKTNFPEDRTTPSEIDQRKKYPEIVPGETSPTLQSSFSDTYSESQSTISQPLSSAGVNAPTSSIPDNFSAMQQQQEKSAEETNQGVFTGCTDTIPVSPVNEHSSEYESSDYYTITPTTPLSTEISDTVFTTALILTDPVTNSVPSGGEIFDSMLGDDGTINQEEVAVYLIDEMESVLESLNDKSTDQEQSAIVSSTISRQTTISSSEIPPMTDNESSNTSFESTALSEVTPQTVDELTEELTPEREETPLVTKRQRSRRRRKKKKTTTPLPNQEMSSWQEINIDGKGTTEGTDSSITEDPARPRNSGCQTGSSCVDYDEEMSTDGQSSDNCASEQNGPPIEFQPSFQEPPSPEPSSTSKLIPSSSYYADYEDSLLLIARAVSQIATYSIRYIQSSDNLNLGELCAKLNELSDIVNIPLLNNCEEIPLIDYLLHALRAVAKTLKGV